MRYVYYASLYTFWAMMPDGIPDRGGWAEMATFLEECLLVIQLGGDDRFKLKKVNPVVDEGYETGDASECGGGGFRGCVGDEYSEDEELSEPESESEHDCDDVDPESEMETVIDDEEYITTDGGENDMADELIPETLGWGRMNAESGLERGLGRRDSGYQAWALKNRLKYGTTFHWDDENGEPTFDDVRCQLRQMVCHDLREIEIKHSGRVYTKPALGFR